MVFYDQYQQFAFLVLTWLLVLLIIACSPRHLFLPMPSARPASYCECFRANVYCGDACRCLDCHNVPSSAALVLATRAAIQARNPYAFAPRIVAGSALSTGHSTGLGSGLGSGQAGPPVALAAAIPAVVDYAKRTMKVSWGLTV